MKDIPGQFETQNNTKTDEIDLLALAGAIWSKWYFIAAASVLGILCAFLYASYCVTPTYQSRVSFFVYNNPNQISQSGTVNNSDLQAAESLATTYSKILKSNTMLDAVLANLNGRAAVSRSSVSGMVNASVVKDTQLLEVTVTSASPETAYAIALSFSETAPDEIVRITKAGSVEVVDQPELSYAKSSPRTSKILLMGAMAGALIAAAGIVVHNLLDKTIYTSEDISKGVNISFLGKIPSINAENDKASGWKPEDASLSAPAEPAARHGGRGKSDSEEISHRRLLNNDSSFDIKEAYVKLRTSLMFCMTADNSRPCKSFAVTSPNPSEGKSLTAANIAVSFAMLGKRVLLIDADMRKPNQHRLWNLNISGGLSDLLIDSARHDVVKIADLPLWIVCTGTVPPNPSELLSTEYMKNFIHESSEKYDYVIIDTPPINTVADAQIISTYVDGIVLIARSGETGIDELSAAISAAAVSDGHLCGVVLNNLEAKYMAYGYKTKYRYKYKYKTTSQY
ncbi:MAG: polysaccharide biosynthesis tyrosine autokinase [Clostridia bacterium]|nr:polysaccharide biosynthesis tyrosine autokinase [Clostridia bacterium]